MMKNTKLYIATAAFAVTLLLTGCGPATGLLGDIKSFVTPSVDVQFKYGNYSIASSGGLIVLSNVLPGDSTNCIVTLKNLGTANTIYLSGSPIIEISGKDAECFSIASMPASTIAPQSSTTFTVTCAPSSLGIKHATLSLRSDNAEGDGYILYVVSAGALAKRVGYINGSASDLAPGVAVQSGTTYLSVLYGNGIDHTLRCATSADGGQSFSATHATVATGSPTAPYYSTLAGSGESLFATYYNGSVYYQSSSDGGATWGTEATLSSAGQYSSISASGSTLLTAYNTTESHNPIYSTVSTSGGSSWEPSVLIDNGTDDVYYCDATIDNSNAASMYSAYYDITDGTLLCVHSSDSGATWETPVLVTSVGDANSGTVCHPIEIIASEGTVYILYYDFATSAHAIALSTDSGSSWTTQQIAAAGADTAALVRSSTTLYVAYYNSEGHASLARSSDGGSNWTITVVDRYQSGSSSGIGLTVFDSIVCIAYRVNYYDVSGDYTEDLLFARSTDGGATWQ